MTTTSTARAATAGRLPNKVPEVTIWFWIIKILCTQAPAAQEAELATLLKDLGA